MTETYQRTQDILEDLLFIGELESDSLPKQSTDVRQLVESCQSMAQVSLEEKGIAYEFDLPDGPVYALESV